MKQGTSASFSNPVQPSRKERPKKLPPLEESNELKLIRARLEEISSADYLAATLSNALKEAFQKAFTRLDRGIRAATAFHRIKWWFEARLQGFPFSEYELLKIRNYRIDQVLLLCPESQLLLQQVSRNSDHCENSGQVPGVLTGIRDHLKNSFSSDGEPTQFSFGERKVIIESTPDGILGAVATGDPPPVYRKMMRETLRTIHSESENDSAEISGDIELPAAASQPEMHKLLCENQSERNNSKWRAWLALGVTAAVPVLFAVQIQKDQVYRARIEAAINDEPGIEILGYHDRLFRKDRLSILRDPMAISMTELLASARVPNDWRTVTETAFISLDEPYSSFRDRENSRKETEMQEHHRNEIAALYQEFEKQSSKTAKKEDHLSLIQAEFFRKYPISKTADLVWIEGLNWELVGTAVDPYYSQITKANDNLIIGGGNVSLDKFSIDIPEELRKLRSEIPKLVISYRGNDIRISNQGLSSRSVLHEKLTRLVMLHHTFSLPKPEIELHATPIVGVTQGQYVALASARLRDESAAIQKSPVGSHVEITTFLDNALSPGRTGIYVLVK